MTNKIDERILPQVTPGDVDPRGTEETSSVQLSIQRTFDVAMSEIEALHQGWLVKSAAIADERRTQRT